MGAKKKPHEKIPVEAMIRVDHAGEYGATRIYAGQLAVLNKKPSAKIIRHMAEQEKEHLDTFNKLVAEKNVRPTVLMPVWHVAGYLLGAGTALLGEKAAMACTVAVEEVIDEHYKQQMDDLENEEPELKKIIKKFRDDEIEHKNIGIEQGAEEAPAYPILKETVKLASRLAIWLSTRV